MNSDDEGFDPIFALDEEFRKRLVMHSDIIDHLQFMHDTVLKYPNPVVIEMGVRTGNSTSALLSAVTRLKHKRGELWSVDINEPQVPEYWHGIPAWRFKQGDSVSPDVLKWMPCCINVAFMDTSHTFEQQLAELRAYVPRVVPGGTVLIHDTQCVPMDEFQSDSFRPTPEVEGPVADALYAYCEETGLTWWNHHSDTGLYGMGVIEIPGDSDD